MKVVYVAGPYRGPDSWAIAENIRKAERLALEVWAMDAAALCPHANTAHFQGALPDEVWLIGDLVMLERCDAMIVVQPWTHSKGTLAEIEHAQRKGIPVFQDLGGLREWLEWQQALAEAK